MHGYLNSFLIIMQRNRFVNGLKIIFITHWVLLATTMLIENEDGYNLKIERVDSRCLRAKQTRHLGFSTSGKG